MVPGIRHAPLPAAGGRRRGLLLLHAATPVTRGTRYAVLPCLYDDAAAAVRQANLASVVPPAPPPLAGATAQR